MDKDYLNRGAVWKNSFKEKPGQPDFNGKTSMNLKIHNGYTNFKGEVVDDVTNLVTYDKDGNEHSVFTKNAEGKITGINLYFNVSAWKRKEGGAESSPALTFAFEPNLATDKNKEIPFPKLQEKVDNTDKDIPF